MVDSSPGLTRLVERGLRDLRVEPQRHQVVQRLGQFARELGVEQRPAPASLAMRAAVPVSCSPFSSASARTPCTIGKDAALLEVERVALRLRGDEIVEEADRRRKGVDRAGEARQMHPLAVHEVDQILLGRAQQLGVAGRRLGVVEDRDVHRPRFRRQARASGGSRRDSRRASSTRRGLRTITSPGQGGKPHCASASNTSARNCSRSASGTGPARMSPLSWSVRKVCSPRPSLPITIRQPASRIDFGATSAKSLAMQVAVEIGDDLADDVDLDALAAQQSGSAGRSLRAARARSATSRGAVDARRRRAANCRRGSSEGRCPRARRRIRRPRATATRRLLCLVILQERGRDEIVGRDADDRPMRQRADRAVDRPAVEDRRVRGGRCGSRCRPPRLARRTAHRTCSRASARRPRRSSPSRR